jgi:TonB family protein
MKKILIRLAFGSGILLPGAAALAQDVDLSYSWDRPLPEYPRQAAIDCVSGEVLAKFTVVEDGRVEHAEIVRSYPDGVFDQVVVEALERWTVHAAQGTELQKLFKFDLGLDHCE